ncbi:SIMPL domain-containing protein [Rhizobiaceae bacterium BDR2-2]|uniref:SIMPL domain-containing protein n=1 Tax=Ectorhizobium quercum TaxID=2965071 RepID=A0AAE3MX25_9HYPH|nr:SIMPL domain-containing protein [Ectorhizobium quercum]MCX8996514.1 SIMPL domain-containing protein [Ectorhizobium quercum]
MRSRSIRHFVLAAAATGGLALAALPAGAQQAAPAPAEATITVSGEGTAALAPDMAVVDLGVLREAETAAEALSANNTAMADVLAALAEQGIEEKDVQTSGFTIQPQYRHDEPKNGRYEPPVIIGYQVQNGLTVRVRDLDKLGGVIDSTVKLGVNQGGNIRFTNDKPDAAVEEARRNAMSEAIAKARTLAEAAGVKLGRVISINENFMRPMPAPQMMMRAAAAKEMSDAVPVAAGENTYSVTVNISYAIDQ